MTRLPRDVGGDDLIAKLRELGYHPTRQTGSHVRLSRALPEAEHHITIPRHRELRVGTLNSILTEIARASDMTKSELVSRLFG